MMVVSKMGGYAARSYRTTAVVLRTYDLGEADRIITLLSPEHGQIRAVAKGIRRCTSRFGARLEPYTVVTVQVVSGRSLDILSQAESIASYGVRLAHHYEKYTAAAVMAEVLEKVSTDAASAAEHYRLFVGALAALARSRHPIELIVNSYLLRALACAGWAASFHACARCDTPGPHSSVVPALGGGVCFRCRPPGAGFADPATMELLAALAVGDWARAEISSPVHRRQAAAFVASFVQWHLESSLRSLSLAQKCS